MHRHLRILCLAFAIALATLAIAADSFSIAESAYARLIAEHARRGGLDAGAAAARVQQVFARLVAHVDPRAGPFTWEIHVTRDPEVAAFCMGRGKILVGAPFVERMQLQDGEIAMLVAHEMAHALAGHRREPPTPSGGDGDPAGELQRNAIAIGQEEEADRLGFELARRAGWTREALLGFFEKLAADVPAGQFSSSHASAAQRLEQARRWK